MRTTFTPISIAKLFWSHPRETVHRDIVRPTTSAMNTDAVFIFPVTTN